MLLQTWLKINCCMNKEFFKCFYKMLMFRLTNHLFCQVPRNLRQYLIPLCFRLSEVSYQEGQQRKYVVLFQKNASRFSLSTQLVSILPDLYEQCEAVWLLCSWNGEARDIEAKACPCVILEGVSCLTCVREEAPVWWGSHDH